MRSSDDDAFRQAVTAIDAGNVEQLQRLLEAEPSLATDRLETTPKWLRTQVGDAAQKPIAARCTGAR